MRLQVRIHATSGKVIGLRREARCESLGARGRTTKLTNRRGPANGDEKGRKEGREMGEMGMMLHHACPSAHLLGRR